MRAAIALGLASVLAQVVIWAAAKIQSARRVARIRQEQLASRAQRRRMAIDDPISPGDLRAGRVRIGSCRLTDVDYRACTVACVACHWRVPKVPLRAALHVAGVHTATCHPHAV